jgi:hypothetical protein
MSILNSNQKIFEVITGFRASYIPSSASLDYDNSDLEVIQSVVVAAVEYLDIELTEEVDVSAVAEAIHSFHACDSDNGCDLDAIFNSLAE